VRSLRGKLFAVWLLSVAAAVFVGWLLVSLYRQSTTAQLARADAAVAHACEQIAERYDFYTSGWAGPASGTIDARTRRDLLAVLRLGLADRAPELGGGIWQSASGPLAALGPFHEEGNDGEPLPRNPRVAQANADALTAGAPVTEHIEIGPVTFDLHACPLGGPVAGLTAWTAMPVLHARGLDALRLGLGVLLALVLGIALSLTALVLGFGRGVKRIEAALAAAGADDLPSLAATGPAELDRIVGALNAAGARLAEARRRSAELTARVAQNERLAALGRVAAGVAHEIRNPIAAMRLRAENALATDDPARRTAALQAVLGQIARLDRLSGELLTMTQRRTPEPEAVDLRALLGAAANDQRADGVAISVEAAPVTCVLDPALMRRALDALLDNAVRHAGAGGTVTLRAAVVDGTARIEVADSGAGVPPELRDSLFEPFVTSRADGTGLGLAIARELVTAQGGRLVLARAGGERPGEGAAFLMELPCRPS
jgi:signal transduction histidine kinase